MTSQEIRTRIDLNNQTIEKIIQPGTFTLNEAAYRILKENDELRAQCQHEFNDDGICIYCDFEEDKDEALHN